MLEVIRHDALLIDFKTLEAQAEILREWLQCVVPELLGHHQIARIGCRHQGDRHGLCAAVGQMYELRAGLDAATGKPCERRLAVFAERGVGAEGRNHRRGKIDRKTGECGAHVVHVQLLTHRFLQRAVYQRIALGLRQVVRSCLGRAGPNERKCRARPRPQWYRAG